MNIDIKKLAPKISAVLKKLRPYSLFICIILVLCIYLFIVVKIRQLANQQPSTTDVTNKLVELQTPKLDQDAVDTILQLEEESIEIRTLFNEARQNPFQE